MINKWLKEALKGTKTLYSVMLKKFYDICKDVCKRSVAPLKDQKQNHHTMRSKILLRIRNRIRKWNRTINRQKIIKSEIKELYDQLKEFVCSQKIVEENEAEEAVKKKMLSISTYIPTAN